MIDITKETAISLTDAAKRLPSRPRVETLWRWRTTGCHGIRLETALIGGRRVTSIEALQRFVDRTTAAADGEIPKRSITRRQRAARIARAERELKTLMKA